VRWTRASTAARKGACAPHCSLETRRPCATSRSGLGGDGKPWRIGTEVYGDRDILPRDVISRRRKHFSNALASLSVEAT
jgi:hypothetical protein